MPRFPREATSSTFSLFILFYLLPPYSDTLAHRFSQSVPLSFCPHTIKANRLHCRMRLLMNPLPKLKDGLAALLECRVEVEKREILWPLFFDDSVVLQILAIIPFCQNLLDPRCPWTPGATARPIAPMINQKESQHDPARGGSARFPRMRSSKLDFLSKFPSTSDIMNVVRRGSER